jgi:hypothetical protein
LKFVQWAKWSRFAIVVGSDASFVVAAGQLASRSQQAETHVQAPMTLNLELGLLDTKQLDSVAAAKLRVVIVIARSPEVLRVALAAQGRGMVAQGWAWLGLDTVAGAELSAIDDNLESTEAAKAAMHGWVYFEPHNAAPAAFFDHVAAATRANFPNQFGSLAQQLDALSSPFAVNMYDAVMLYAMAVGSNSSQRLNGRPVVLAMMNISFDGMSGRVELDTSGDMKESIRAMNYVVESNGAMRGRQIGVCDWLSPRFSPLVNNTVVWPGGVQELPSDSAVTPAPQGFSTSWLLAGAFATALVVMIGLVMLVRRKKALLQGILLMLLTEVGQLVFSECTAMANLATDGIVFDRMLRGNLKVSSEIYAAVYATIMCFGTVSTALSFCSRLRNIRLVRTHLQELAPQGEALASKAAHRQARQHEWELLKTHRKKVTLSLTLLSVAVQGVPEST